MSTQVQLELVPSVAPDPLPGLLLDIIWRSPIKVIGKHEWMHLIYTHFIHGPVGLHVWRPRQDWSGPYLWRKEEEWPAYNSNDGEYAGMPRTLRRFWDSYKDDFKAAHKAAEEAYTQSKEASQ